jgi:hypothetical protein
MALQIRRGPTADREGKIFAEGEIIYDTQLQEVFIGDGTTLGGKTVSTYTDNQSKDAAASLFTHNVGHANVSFAYDSALKRITATVTLDGTYNDLVLDTTPELGGDLSLNDKNITLANGTVVINGITGSITADVTGNLIGNADTVTNGIYTNQTFFIGETEIGITRATGAQTLTGVSISGNAATVTNGVYTSGDQTISGSLTASSFNGDIYGSVYGTDGTTLLVDSENNSIAADTISAANLTITGNLIVSGTTTTVNSTTVEIADLNITLAKGSVDAAAADGAGITIDGAGATLTYNSADDSFVFNKEVSSVNGFVGNVSGNVTGDLLGNVTGDVTGDVTGNLTLNSSGTIDASEGRILIASGSVSSPSLAFDTDPNTDTGFYYTGQGTIGIATDGEVGATFAPFGVLTVTGSVVAPLFNGDVNSIGESNFTTIRVPYIRAFANGNTIQIQDPTDFLVSASAPDFTVSRTLSILKELDSEGINTQLKAKFTGESTTFGVPVQFGKYTTTERNLLRNVVEVVAASWTLGTATLEFEEQAGEIFDVGALITITEMTPTGYNLSNVTVTATTATSVSYAIGANPGTYVSGGVITGPVANGTVIYNKTAHQFQGYANGSWVSLN